MPNRKPRNLVKRQVYLSVLLVLAVSLAFSTGIGGGEVDSGYYPDGTSTDSNNILAFNFTLQDGGDTIINGSVDPGDALYSFEDGGTMFLNQSDDPTRGLNGFNAGEDIFNVTLLHNASRGSFSGEMIGNFSNDTRYADGGNYSNSRFDGRGNKTPEMIVRDNGSREGWLDSQDYVVVNGSLNASNFSEEVVFVDTDGDGRFDNGTDVIVRNSSNSPNIEDSDTVLRPGEALSYFGSGGNEVTFPDADNDGIYQSEQAIVRNHGEWVSKLEKEDDVLDIGDANLRDASLSNLTFVANGSRFDKDGEPIYHESVSDLTANASNDTRIGPVTVKSEKDNDPTTVDLGLETLAYINSSRATPHDNEIGRELYNISSDNHPGEGSFYVYELDDGAQADNTLDPKDSDDQEILVYDLDAGTGISSGETLIYNSDTSNDNVSVDVGEEFEDEFPDVDESYQVSAELGYMDNGSGSFEPSADNVSVNISYNSDWVIVNLAPNEYENTLGGAGTFEPNNATMRFWNASQSGTDSYNFDADGLFVDTDNSTNVTHGDVRIGEWTYQHEAGEVGGDALDRGASLQAFSDEAAFIDADDSETYNPGDGTLGGDREAIVSYNDLKLGSGDYIIREGEAALKNFNKTDPQTLYIDSHNSGKFEHEEAIILNRGDKPKVLEDEDEVIKPGLASFTRFNDSELYVENGSEPGFEKGSMEAIIYDNNSDGVLTRGPLDSGDHVIAAGYANLQKFEQPPREENDSGLVFVDRNRDGRFSSAEDILNITLVTNGSDSEKINGSEIFNFADSTKHNGSEHYTDGNAIVNDTDGNGVFQDVLESLEIVNGVHVPDYWEEKLSSQELEGGLELFRGNGDGVFSRDEDEKIASLTGSGTTWTASGLEENITDRAIFYVSFNVTNVSRDVVLKMESELSSIGLAGGEDLSGITSPNVQKIDSYPPQYVGGNTGSVAEKNRSDREKVVLAIDEEGSGVVPDSVNDGDKDFEILRDDFKVTFEDVQSSNNNILLTLNGSLPTNATPEVEVVGSFADYSGEKTSSGLHELDDHLKPLIERVRYQDEDADGRIDELDVFFSENVSYDSFEPGDWAVTDNNISNFQVSAGTVSDSYMLELDASAEDGVTGVEENEPELNFTQQGNTVYDSNSNSLSTVKNVTIEDDAGPAITGAETRDPDFDAEVEEISLNFSENISDHDSTINTSAFNLSEGEIVSADTVDANDSHLKLEVRDLGSSATPEVTMFTGYLYDFHNNTAADNQTFTATEDGARPVLLYSEVDEEMSNANYTIVEMTFSEPVQDTNSDGEGVNLSGKEREFMTTGFDNVRRVNFSEPLQTGDMPNITAFEQVSDADGNDVALEDAGNVTVNTFRREIVKGWNFVSLPLAGEVSVDIGEVFNESRIDVIWTRRDDTWQTYDSDPQAEGNDFTEFVGGVGYLVDARENFTWSVNVETPLNLTESGDTAGSTPTPTTDVAQGWSLLGHYQEYTLAANQTETSDPPGAFASFDDGSLGRVHEQSQPGSSNTVEITDISGDNSGEMLHPGSAYWVEADSNVDYNAVE
jgi:hypothetical protein